MASSPIFIRIAFWPYWLFICVEASIGFTLILFLTEGSKIDWIAYWILLGVISGLSAIGSWGMQMLYVVRVSNTEIKGFNSLGLPLTVKWNNLTELKPLNFLGIKFLRIYSAGNYWALWFPLQISNSSGNCEELAKLTEIPHELLFCLKRAKTATM